MSGGSMNYLYSSVSDARFDLGTTLRRAFRAHLDKVAKALHDIEWVDSGDYGPGDEDAAIRACLEDSVLALVTEEARRTLEELQRELARAEQLVPARAANPET